LVTNEFHGEAPQFSLVITDGALVGRGGREHIGCVPLALPVRCVRVPIRTGVASGTRFSHALNVP
jgi:hypothetical protein